MDKYELIKILTKFLKNRVFNYKGPIVYTDGFDVDIDYKIEIIDVRQMISVGEWYDHVILKVKIIKYNNQNSKVFFEDILKSDNEELNKILPNLYRFKIMIESDIMNDVIRFFDDNLRILIGEMIIDVPKTEQLTEQKMFRLPTRKIVRDILTILKNEKEGEFYLPENDEYGMGYSFNIPVHFTVELHLRIDESMNDFKINAYYSEDDDVIEVLIIYNPNNLRTLLYDIVGELNEVVAHELEHVLQSYRGELPSKKINTKKSLKYYTQPHEISAQVTGFKRLAKLRKLPFEDVVRDWFKTHKDIHNLKPKEEEIVINKIMDYIK